MHSQVRNELIYGLIKKKNLLELYVSIFIRALATSLVGVFIPLYLYKEIGYSLNDVFMFFAVFYAFLTFLPPMFAKIILKIGIKVSMVLSALFSIVFYFVLNAMTTYNINLVLVAFIYALGTMFFWMPYHIEFSRHSDRKNRSIELGVWYSLLTSVGIIGPIMGAVIATFLGFNMLYVAAAILLFISAAPIFLIKERKIEQMFRIKDFMFNHAKRDILVFISDGIRTIVSYIIWPVFMFVQLGTYLAIGAIKSAVAVLNIIASLIVGKLSDRYNRIGVLRIGVFLNSITLFIRSFFGSVTSLFIVTTAGDFTDIAIGVPLHSKLYDTIASKGHRRMEYIVFREVWLNGARAVMFLIVFIFSSMELSFVIAGLTNFLMFLL